MAQRSANERLFDEAVRRKVYLLRFAEGEVQRINELLDAVERDLLAQIAASLANGATPSRLEALLQSVRDLQASGMGGARDQIEQAMADLAREEAAWEAGAIERVSPVELQLALVPIETLQALASSDVAGLSVARWFESLEQQTVANIERALRIGISQGETIDTLLARIRGTRANGYRDGVMQVARRDAAAIARTAVSEASNAARDLVWQQNADIVLCLRWTSVLDGRTTPICQSRDGALAPIAPGVEIPEDAKGQRLEPPMARPPAHVNCRSIMVAVLDADGVVGRRPFVADDRVRAEREREFRAEARKRGVSIREVRSEWARERVGQVPASTTYAEWFARQPQELQRSILGPARFTMYQQGRPLGAFVDQSGRKLTLEELRRHQ